MPIHILVNKSSVPQQAGRCAITAGAEFQVMVERRVGYRAAYIKVMEIGVPKAKVHKVIFEQTHVTAPATWRAAPGTEVHVAWQPERAMRSRHNPKLNSGDHTCTLECECVPEYTFEGDERNIQTYPPFPGMPSSTDADQEAWVDRWHTLPLTAALVAAKRANKIKQASQMEEYDVRPADVEIVRILS